MDKLDFELFGLRFRAKLKNEHRRYLFVEVIRGPRAGGWYLTIPLSPLGGGPDAGYVRPHLSRRLGRRKERLALDSQTLMPFSVEGEIWPGALKFTADEFTDYLQKLQPMAAELAALEHYVEHEYDDARLRQLIVAVHVPDPEREEAISRKLMEQVERDARLVMNEMTLREASPEFGPFWRPAEALETLAPGTRDEPLCVKLRAPCGAEWETSVYRREDGVWVERRFCCSGDEDERRRIVDRYVGPEARAAWRAIAELLGISADDERTESGS